LVSGNRVQRHEVRLGARTEGGQTILSGILPGTILAIGDFTKLNDGSKIRVSP